MSRPTTAASQLDPTDLITDDETATLTGLSTSSLAKHRRENTGPTYYKLGFRTVRYSRNSVLAWIAERRVTPGAVRVRRPAA